MTSTPVLSLNDPCGNPLASSDSGQAALLTRNPSWSVYTKTESSTEYEDFVCVDDLVIDEIAINADTSQCNTTTLNKTNLQIADYDGHYGVDFDSHTTGRSFILIADETGETPPAVDDIYGDDKQLFFVGYNLKGNSFDLNKRELKTQWVGLEYLMNEFIISGCITKEPNTALKTSLKCLSQAECIFNEDGYGNRGAVKVNGVYLFNNSGILQSAFWTLKDILNYVLRNFLLVSSSDTAFLALDKSGLGFNLLPYINHYCKFNYEFNNDVLLDEIAPMNFSLEGLGMWDAILKIVGESKKFMIYKGYASNGTVRIKIKAKRPEDRAAGDQPMLINIGAYMQASNSTILINGANINLNRETKNIGRVILNGDFLRLNTLCSSMANSSFSGAFSSESDAYSSISFIDQSNKISLNLIDQTDNASTQAFIAVPRNDLATTIGDLTAELNVYNDEDATTKIFDGIKALQFDRIVSRATTDERAKSTKDMGVYIGKPFFAADGQTHPKNTDDGTPYYFIDKAERLNAYFIVKHKSGKHSQVIVDGSILSGLDAEGSFAEYATNSPIVSEAPFKTAGITPILMRANIKTDYRIKGIADLGEDFDPAIHSTIVIKDDDFKLTLSYKDAEFDDLGNFTPITDGFINYGDQDVLLKIQNKAEAIFEKYRVKQNSGHIQLNGLQRTIKIGDYINKFTGSGRDINTPMMVRSMIFRPKEKLTEITLGT